MNFCYLLDIFPPLLKLRAVLAWTHFCEPHLQSKDLPRQFARVRALTDSVPSPTQSAQWIVTTLRVNVHPCVYVTKKLQTS